jgi:cardiolipin hydrolase
MNINKFLFCRRLIQLLEEATSSLDICMFFFTCQDLSEVIIRVHRKGVSVRVIADADMADGCGTQIPELRKCGKQQL